MFASLFLLQFGCLQMFRTQEADPIGDRLAAADTLYEQRHDKDSLLKAIDLYLAVQADAPDDRRPLHRLSRAYVALGWGYRGEQEQRNYELAREYGVRCLALNKGFAARLGNRGGRIKASGVKQLGAADQACLNQTLLAWIRWSELRGAASLVDLETLDVLANRSLQNDPGGWVPQWSNGMVRSLAGDQRPEDTEALSGWFVNAMEMQPQLGMLPFDWAEQVLEPSGQLPHAQEVLRSLPQQYPATAETGWALENRSSAARAAAALGRQPG